MIAATLLLLGEEVGVAAPLSMRLERSLNEPVALERWDHRSLLGIAHLDRGLIDVGHLNNADSPSRPSTFS